MAAQTETDAWVAVEKSPPAYGERVLGVVMIPRSLGYLQTAVVRAWTDDVGDHWCFADRPVDSLAGMVAAECTVLYWRRMLPLPKALQDEEEEEEL